MSNLDKHQFPNDLLRRHQELHEQFKKFKRVLFKRFGPNLSDISNEFNQLAIEFKNASLFEYAGLNWQNASECEHIIENTFAEVDYLLKAARSYHEADKSLEDLCIRSNDKSFIECALQCYNDAIALLSDGSPMKLAIVREMKTLKPSVEFTSGFMSPSHNIYDLEKAAEECVRIKDFVTALDKRTEIFNNILERKKECLYSDVLRRNEISRIFLLLLLELPPLRLTEAHTNLIEKFTKMPPQYQFAEELGLSKELFFCIHELVLVCKLKAVSPKERIIDRIFEFNNLETEHYLLLKQLSKKFLH